MTMIASPPLSHLLPPTLAIFCGYAAYYFCRINFSISSPSMISSGFLQQTDYGFITSAGYLAATVGKVVMGVVSDAFDVKMVFIWSLMISVISTLLFPLASNVYILALLWCTNRWFQSVGWLAVVKIVTELWPKDYVGTIIGFGALSYCLSETLTRLILSSLLSSLEWPQIYLISAAISLVLITPSYFYIPTKLSSEKLYTPLSSHSLSATSISSLPSLPLGSYSLLLTKYSFLTKPRFYTILVMSLCLTIFRETYASWTPVYLHTVFRLSEQSAGLYSVIYPIAGGLSALIGGWLMDRLRSKLVTLMFLSVVLITQWGLWDYTLAASTGSRSTEELIDMASSVGYLIGLNAFGTFAPFTFLDGVYIKDLVETHSTATAVGIINAVGYLGAGIASYMVGKMDWASVMHCLVWLAFACLIAAAAMGFLERRRL